MSDKTQKEIDDEEWHNPANWGGIRPFRAYFSKRDSRPWVPAIWNNMWSFKTLNYGHRFGPLMQAFMGLVMVAIFCFGIIAAGRQARDPQVAAPKPHAKP